MISEGLPLRPVPEPMPDEVMLPGLNILPGCGYNIRGGSVLIHPDTEVLVLPQKVNISLDELPKATFALIALNVLFFVFLLFAPELVLKSVLEVFTYGPRNYFMFFAPATSLMLHASVLSLVFNSLFLLLFGSEVESRTGFFRFVFVYVIAGFAGSALEMGVRFALDGAVGPGAGGSAGAVSGIAGLLVYRLWYSRRRTLMEPSLVSLGFELPAAPFIFLWFFMDIVIGVQSMGEHVISSGHVAQVGGFITGVLMAMAIGHGHEAKLGMLREKVMDRFNDGGQWEKAVSSLKKLEEMAPEDGGLQRDFARLHARQKKKKEASLHYRKAVEAYYKKDNIEAAKTILEHVEALKAPMAIQVHLKVARELVNEGHKKEARKVLLAALRRQVENSAPFEQAIAFYVLLLLDLGEKKEAKRAYGIFRQRFPKSEQDKKILGSVSKPAGSIFPVKEGASLPHKERAAAEGQADREPGFGGMSLETAVDPWFVPTWFILFTAFIVLDKAGVLPGAAVMGLAGLGWQVLVLAVAIFATAQRKFSVVQLLIAFIKEKIAEAKAKRDARAEEEAEDDDEDDEDDEDMSEEAPDGDQ